MSGEVCRFCGGEHEDLYCGRLKAVEFMGGEISRVEFLEKSDMVEGIDSLVLENERNRYMHKDMG